MKEFEELQQIKSLVETFTEVKDISEKKQSAPYFVSRAIFYHIAKKKTEYSLNTIGGFVGKDHASVINAMGKLEMYLRDYPEYRRILKYLDEADIDVDLCTDNADKERIVKLEKKVFSLSKELLSRKESGVPQSHQDLVKLLNRIPEHQVDLVKLRLDAIVRMLPKN